MAFQEESKKRAYRTLLGFARTHDQNSDRDAGRLPSALFEFLQNMAESVRKQTKKEVRCPECEQPVAQIVHEEKPLCLGQVLLETARNPAT